MKYFLLLLGLSFPLVFGRDCFKENERVVGRPLVKEKMFADSESAEACFSSCSTSAGCAGMVFFARFNKCLLLAKVLDKTFHKDGVVSAVMEDCGSNNTGSTAAPTETTPKPGTTPKPDSTPDPSGSTTPKPVTGEGESEITVRQTWCQEPDGYDRRAIVRQPTTSSPGEKVPLVVCLHGNGGSANLAQWKELWDKNLIVAAEGYDRSWNIFKEASKAPDVEFINALIAKVGEEHPNADMDNVVLVGYSNGAGMIHRLLVETPNPRPFHKVFPMASILTESQYNNGKFWKSSSVDCESENEFDVEVIPASPGPQIYTIQGDNDKAIPYTGGPGVAGNTFLAAQDAVFLYAKTLFGYTGAQQDDSAGEATEVDSVFKYSYAEGKVNHYKVVGGTHGDTSKNIWPIVKAIINP